MPDALVDVPAIVAACRDADLDVVLLDIGGVVAEDVWERLWLDPESGIATRHGLDLAVAERVGLDLWRWVAREPADGDAYWDAAQAATGITIDRRERAGLLERVRPNPLARQLVEDLRDLGLRIGLASNNTSFWWSHQLAVAGIADLLDDELSWLSFAHGVTKSDTPGLLELAAAATDPKRALFIDDRQNNIERATALGFTAIRYRFELDEAH